MTPPLWQKVKRNSKASWWKWKWRVKSWLKAQHSENKDHGIRSHHFMANRWGNNRNSERLYFWEFQNHCRWWLQYEVERWLLLGRKAMTNLDSIFKSRDITLPTKVHLVKAMVFPVVMYGCESWTTKKLSTEELMLLNCGWRRLLRVPWTCKEIQPVHSKGNQSWIFIGRTDADWKSNTLATWCEELTH